LDLQPGKGSSLVWKGRIRVPNQPWVTVVVPDDDVSVGRDLVGSKP
jgi:hypothetical protein